MILQNNFKLDEYLRARKQMVDKALDEFLPAENTFPSSIFRSARYSVFAGGKRIRPILCMASAEALGGNIEDVLPVGCAIELIHSYSLIHDDLPAMDDDNFRRGLPTNHKVFGEAIAVLAGDALLTEAFNLLSRSNKNSKISSDILIDIIQEISQAAGYFGMIGGQVVDLESEGENVDLETLEYIHRHKTEALLKTSIRTGAIAVGAHSDDLQSLSVFGTKIGLAFQIADDILDIESTTEVLGKDIGSDEARQKVTYPALIGLEASKNMARDLVNEALAILDRFDEKATPLRLIAQYIISRKS